MNTLNLDFIQKPLLSLALTSTMVMTHSTTIQTEGLLLVSILSVIGGSGDKKVADLSPLYNEFIDTAYHSLPVVDDARRLLLKFFDFEQQFKAAMQIHDAQWVAAYVQMQRLKDAIVLLDTKDAEPNDESGLTDEEAA